jgi:hypothetical protein
MYIDSCLLKKVADNITDYFRTQLLYSHSLVSRFKDYELEKTILTCLPSFFVAL